jgi:hypothetical protein
VLDDESGFGGDFVRRLGQRRQDLLDVDWRDRDFGASSPPNPGVAASRGSRLGYDGRGRGTTAARRHCRSGLFFSARTLLTLPARTHSCDLVVREQTQMTANRNVHLTKQRNDFVR